MQIEELVGEIKRKKELKNISDNFVLKLVLKELEKRPYLKELIEKYDLKKLKRNKEFLEFFKSIRKMLHEIYGVFSPRNIKKIYEILDKDVSLETKIKFILLQTRPTRERLNYYREIYRNIWIEDPKVILDLASGFNPISIIFSDKKPCKYYFVDISPDIININELILKEIGVEPYGLDMDIFDIEENTFDERFDHVFLWKTIPIIEKYNEGFTEELLKRINAKYFVLSYPKRSLSGKREIGRAWGPWTYRLAKKLGFKVVKDFEIGNEMFIILSRNSV